MAGRPITARDRRRLKELHAEGLSRNEIARRMNRAASTVSKLAAEMGLDFDRSRTQAGTAARHADAKARRARLALDLVADAERLRKQMWNPCTIHNFGGKENTYNSHDLDQPLFADQLKIMQATGLAVDKHVRLIEIDADQGVGDAKSMLTNLMGALGEAWRADQPDTK